MYNSFGIYGDKKKKTKRLNLYPKVIRVIELPYRAKTTKKPFVKLGSKCSAPRPHLFSNACGIRLFYT